MKKTMLIFAVSGLVTISQTSCKKTFECECSHDNFSQTIDNAKKKDAEEACSAIEANAKGFSYAFSNVTCELK